MCISGLLLFREQYKANLPYVAGFRLLFTAIKYNTVYYAFPELIFTVFPPFLFAQECGNFMPNLFPNQQFNNFAPKLKDGETNCSHTFLSQNLAFTLYTHKCRLECPCFQSIKQQTKKYLFRSIFQFCHVKCRKPKFKKILYPVFGPSRLFQTIFDHFPVLSSQMGVLYLSV